MPSLLRLTVNGIDREFVSLEDGAALSALVAELGFRADRVALEQNGEIVPRTRWAKATVSSGDRLEVVHFVGGGTAAGTLAVSFLKSDSHVLP